CFQHCDTEDPPGDRSRLRHSSFLRREQVKTGEHRGVNGIWQNVDGSTFLRYPAYEFEGKERIASRVRHDLFLECFIQSRRLVLDQLPRLGLRERLQGQGGEVLLPPAPGRTAIQ